MYRVICMTALGLGMLCVSSAQDVPANPDYRARQGITQTPGGDNMPAQATGTVDSAGVCALPVVIPASFSPGGTDMFSDCFVTIADRNGDSTRYFAGPPPEQKRLLVVDERKARSNKRIPVENIESVSIYSPEKATALYGNKARNGAVVVKTKGKK